MLLMKSVAKLNQFGEQIENQSVEFMRTTTLRLFNGLVLFKKRKGEVVAGASTFFTILSFGPLVLLLISLLGYLFHDNSMARDFVMNGIHLSFPKVDPWILRNIEGLVEAQLGPKGSNFVQVLFLAVTCMGVSTTFVFGINTISKVDPDGGLFRDDVKSALVGFCVAIFLVLLLILSQRQILVEYIVEAGFGNGPFTTIIESNVFASFVTLIFFTFFYKLSASIDVKYTDAFFGAATFMLCFLIGKSFYWIYLTYFKDDLVAEHGHFYNFIVILLWVYYLMCSLFYGASVAYVGKKKSAKSRKKK